MFLRLKQADGTIREIPLGDQAMSIGRSEEADVVVADEKVSRLHCVIRLEDDMHHVRDLKSRNGSYLNEERIEDAPLRSGDRLRLGSSVFEVMSERPKGPQTVLHEVEEEMASGKGYTTILRDIVGKADPAKQKKRKE